MAWPTLEVRWFFRGGCPGSVGEWFGSGDQDPGPPEERVDDYLRLGRRDLGIKTRGGLQLDIKLKTGDGPAVALPSGMAGRLEAWTKWSFGLDTPLPADDSWVRVEKRRRLRRYAYVDGRTDRVGATEVLPGAGCSAELVEVSIDGQPSWGFGFEAFGDDEHRPHALAATCARLVEELSPAPLDFAGADSHSYPSWLVAVADQAPEPPSAP